MEEKNQKKDQKKDISNKTVLDNPVLCCQFLKDNIDIPILKNLRPEDIEDCTELFRSYFGVEYEADTVKRVRVRNTGENEQNFEFYLLSLIEHKSKVDYNVVIQLLKYMVCIWAEYEKTFGTEYKDKVKTKAFRYPPILPIVYYEGAENWTATLRLKDRIFMNELFAEYIPDFTYCLVNLKDISNEELLEREDEMSLIMLVNKIQNVAELSDFLSLPEEKVTAMMKESPEVIVDIVAMCMQVLCTRLNLSAEETETCVKKVRKRSMGYMWENMEKIDVQAMRKELAEGKKAAEESVKAAEESVKVAQAALEETVKAAKEAAQEAAKEAAQEAAKAAKEEAEKEFRAEIDRLKALLSSHGISHE